MHIRAMHRGVAARAPATPLLQQHGVRDVADKNLAARLVLNLGVAFEAKIRIALQEQLAVNRTMRVMADGATLAQRFVFEHKRPGLLTVTLRARFIEARHGKASRRLENVASVRIVALHAIHPAFDDWMMLRQIELGLSFQMALETDAWIFAWVDDEFAAPAPRFDVLAARTVAGFAPGLPSQLSLFEMHAGVRAGWEHAGDIGMTFIAGPVTRVSRTRNLRRIEHGAADCATGDKRQRQYGGGHQSSQSRHAGPPIHKRPPGCPSSLAGFLSSSVRFRIGGRIGYNSGRANANSIRMATEKCRGGAQLPEWDKTKNQPFAMPSNEDQSFWPGFGFPDTNPKPLDLSACPRLNHPPGAPKGKGRRARRRPATNAALPKPSARG
jgi:hypothetical protein